MTGMVPWFGAGIVHARIDTWRTKNPVALTEFATKSLIGRIALAWRAILRWWPGSRSAGLANTGQGTPQDNHQCDDKLSRGNSCMVKTC